MMHIGFAILIMLCATAAGTFLAIAACWLVVVVWDGVIGIRERRTGAER